MVKETFSGWIRLALALSASRIVRASLTMTEGKMQFSKLCRYKKAIFFLTIGRTNGRFRDSLQSGKVVESAVFDNRMCGLKRTRLGPEMRREKGFNRSVTVRLNGTRL